MREPSESHGADGAADESIEDLLRRMRDARLPGLLDLVTTAIDEVNASQPDSPDSPPAGTPFGRELADSGAASESVAATLWLGRFGLCACVDHLATLRELLGLHGGVLGPLVVARAVLEAAATSWWLFEPDLGPPRRAARGLGLRRRSAEWERDLEAALGLDRPLPLSETKAEVSAEATLAGVPYADGSFGGEKVPSLTRVVKGLLDDLGEDAAAAYFVLSSAAHAERHGAVHLVSSDAPRTYDATLTTRAEHLLPVLEGAVGIAVASTRASVGRYLVGTTESQ